MARPFAIPRDMLEKTVSSGSATNGVFGRLRI